MLKLYAVKQEIIKFINSEWFSTLTDLNATAVIEKLQKQKRQSGNHDSNMCSSIMKNANLSQKSRI